MIRRYTKAINDFLWEIVDGIFDLVGAAFAALIIFIVLTFVGSMLVSAFT